MGSYASASENSRREVNVLVTGFGAGTPNGPGPSGTASN